MTGAVAALGGAALASIPPMTAACVPDAVSGDWNGPGGGTTDFTTATPTGGTGPYTFAWAKVSGDDFTISNPTGQTTRFSFVGTSPRSAVYEVTVTDANHVIARADVTVLAN